MLKSAVRDGSSAKERARDEGARGLARKATSCWLVLLGVILVLGTAYDQAGLADAVEATFVARGHGLDVWSRYHQEYHSAGIFRMEVGFETYGG